MAAGEFSSEVDAAGEVTYSLDLGETHCCECFSAVAGADDKGDVGGDFGRPRDDRGSSAMTMNCYDTVQNKNADTIFNQPLQRYFIFCDIQIKILPHVAATIRAPRHSIWLPPPRITFILMKKKASHVLLWFQLGFTKTLIREII